MPQTYLLKFNIFKIYILKELIYLQIFQLVSFSVKSLLENFI